jgi:hypothetical protein
MAVSVYKPCVSVDIPVLFISYLLIIKVIKSRRINWVERVTRMGDMRNVYNILVGKPEGKRPLRRPRRRWEGNIKMGLREIG